MNVPLNLLQEKQAESRWTISYIKRTLMRVNVGPGTVLVQYTTLTFLIISRDTFKGDGGQNSYNELVSFLAARE